MIIGVRGEVLYNNYRHIYHRILQRTEGLAVTSDYSTIYIVRHHKSRTIFSHKISCEVRKNIKVISLGLYGISEIMYPKISRDGAIRRNLQQAAELQSPNNVDL